MTEESYQVSKLARGTVLDHLRGGSGLRALRALNLPEDCTVMLGQNLPSGRLERKDIIKIEAYELNEDEARKVALISPDATLSIIRDYKVVEKIDLQPPGSFHGLIRCPNSACITNDESVPGAWILDSRDPLRVRCQYCERAVDADQFEFE
jgi:aspartate carbamoyltransferase regulatory subunit